MIDLSIFNDDELEYIVSVIPRARSIAYLQRNAKEFNKIKPGFRAATLSDIQLSTLLYKELQKNNDFIVSLVVGFLNSSLQEITDAYQLECKKRDETTALIYTLNNCFFRGRLDVYFKLVNQEVSQSEIDKLVAAMDILQESINQQQSISNDLDEKDQRIRSLEKDINILVSENERLMQDKEAIVFQNEELQDKITAYVEQDQKLHEEINQCLEQNKKLQKQLEGNREILVHNETEIQGLMREKEALSTQLTEQIVRNQEYLQKIGELEQDLEARKTLPVQSLINNISLVSSDASKFFIPIEIEDFKELILYYMEDSEINNGRELLISYITRIAFAGKPIVGNHSDCRFLVKCLSSTLTNGESLTLHFSNDISINDISNALNSDSRIIYLDNFIGNFNETILYSLLESYHNKIVLISAMFDRTFNYVGTELLSLCYYFNISRLQYKVDIDFDFAELIEQEYIPTTEILQNAPTISLKCILKELDFSQCIRQSLISNIETHDEAISILAFCVIPFLIDVIGKNPFDSSEKLNAYCNKNRNRSLLEQWFVHE